MQSQDEIPIREIGNEFALRPSTYRSGKIVGTAAVTTHRLILRHNERELTKSADLARITQGRKSENPRES